jgi:type IV pilus assembly protein PilY1
MYRKGRHACQTKQSLARQERTMQSNMRDLLCGVCLLFAAGGVTAAAPIASPAIQTLSGGGYVEDRSPFTYNLSSVFSDADTPMGDVLTYSVLSTGGANTLTYALNGTTGEVTFTPVPNASGTRFYVFRATDSTGLTANFTLTITLSAVNDVPSAANDSATMDEVDPGASGSVVIDVLANDNIGDPVTTIIRYGRNWPNDTNPTHTNVSESPPTTQLDESGIEVTVPNGSIALLPDGKLEYFPKPNFSGTDWFTYTIRDADGQMSTATVTVTVIADDDPPRTWSAYTYTVDQGSFLDINATGGLLSRTIDDDGHQLNVFVITPPSIGVLDVNNNNGAFTYTPPATYGAVNDPPVTFVVQYRELPSGNEIPSAQTTITIYFDPEDPPPPIGSTPTINQLFPLADVPLEDAISAEANVLVMMDDSGSMDWAMMVPGASSLFNLSNALFKQPNMATRSNQFYYLHQLQTNTYGGNRNMPTQESIDNNPKFTNNQYGVWRAWNPQYNTIYYDPTIMYEPWIGLDRNGVDFAPSNPTAAVLDPYDALVQTINLTAENLSYQSQNVPSTFNDNDGIETITNNNVHLAHYWTSTAPVGALPAWNQRGTRIDIRSNYTLNSGTVLTSYPGGPARFDCAVDDANPLTCTYAQEIQNFANWFTYYRSREYTAKAALGRSIVGASNLRMGYGVLNNTNHRQSIASLNASYRVGQKRDLLTRVYSLDSNGGTPLRNALDRAGRTFECVSGNVFNNQNTAPGSPSCPVQAAPEGECQANYTLLFSDGEWNENFNFANHDAQTPTDPSPSAFDGGKFADGFSATLADVAMFYYERDLHPSLANRVGVTTRDQQNAPVSAFGNNGETMHQHMKTFTVGFGLTGNFTLADLPTSYTTAFGWQDPTSSSAAKIDDMLHAAVNGRGQPLSADNPVLLTQAFQNAFAEFSNSSISVSAVAFNSTALREDTVEYRGFFNPRFHTGDLRALRVNAATGVVDTASPLWRAAPQLDTLPAANRMIATWNDATNAGIPFQFANLNNDQKLILSSAELDWLRGIRNQEEPNGPYRQRQGTEGLLGDIVHSAPVFVGPPRAFRRDQAPFPTGSGDLYSDFAAAKKNRPRVVYVGANDGMLHGFNAGTPTSNGNGSEVFAYVPNKIIDNTEFDAHRLDQLASLVYAHRYFVDLTPSIEDVYIRPSRTATGKDWTTLLMGGLGAGGKGYFAINTTNPSTSYANVTNAAAAVLWEFTDQDDTYPVDNLGNPLVDGSGNQILFDGRPIRDMGYALSQPQLVMTNLKDGDNENLWMAVFGNGYNATSGLAKLFLLDLDKGANGWAANEFIKLNTGVGTPTTGPMAGLPNGLGAVTVVDKDNNGTADYVYGGDLQGNLYRFDISSANKSNWTVTKIFQASVSGTAATAQPITTAPFVMRHPDEGFLVIVGTGSWLTHADGSSTQIQSIYGIWDRFENSPDTANPASKLNRLVEQTITNVYDSTSPLFQKQRRLSANPVNYEPDQAGDPGVYGWYIDLDPVRPATTVQGAANPDTAGNAPPAVQFPGERAIRRIISRGTAVLITTVVPRDASTCTAAPPGSTFPIDGLTGGNPKRAIFDVNNDEVIDDNDLLTVNGVNYATGIVFDADDLDGTLVDPSMLVGTGDFDFMFISGGDDQVTLRIAPPDDQKTGRLSWRQMVND